MTPTELWQDGVTDRSLPDPDTDANSTSTDRRLANAKAIIRRRRVELGRLTLLNHFVRSRSASGSATSLRTKGVLYLLHNCLPYHSGGYAIRAHGLLKGFQKEGWTVIPRARIGYPYDRKPHETQADPMITIDGIEYGFLENRTSIDTENQLEYVNAYAESVVASIDPSKVGIVVAPSFFQNGFAGRIIADRLGVPLVYEMRGLEWFTRGSSDPGWKHTMAGISSRDVELQAARCADHVFAITGRLRNWLIEAGLPEEGISVLPNGCSADSAINENQLDADDVASKIGISGSFVVGYIGSVVYYEGIDLIIDAVKQARASSGLDIKFLLVGDGPDFARIRRYVQDVEASEFIVLVGRVPHHEVDIYYQLFDTFVMARTDTEVCHAISPLKPLEAMVKGKLLITSDVDAIREMVVSSDGGALLFKAGDANELAQRILEAIENPSRMKEIASRGHQWAIEKREWSTLARKAISDIEEKFGTSSSP